MNSSNTMSIIVILSAAFVVGVAGLALFWSSRKTTPGTSRAQPRGLRGC